MGDSASNLIRPEFIWLYFFRVDLDRPTRLVFAAPHIGAFLLCSRYAFMRDAFVLSILKSFGNLFAVQGGRSTAVSFCHCILTGRTDGTEGQPGRIRN